MDINKPWSVLYTGAAVHFDRLTTAIVAHCADVQLRQ